MAIGASRKRRLVWRRLQMPDGAHSRRLYGPGIRQWSVEVHASIAGYVVCYFLGKVRGTPWFADVYENLEFAMVVVEFLGLSKQARKEAARSRRAMLRTASTPPDIIAHELPPQFAARLYPLIERPMLRPFFNVLPQRRDHYDVRPIEPLTLAKRVKALNPVDRLLLVTICGLYNSELAADAFKRSWNPMAVRAFVGINALRATEQELAGQWYGLLATYPGW